MFSNVYLDSWAVEDNMAIMNIVVIVIAIAIGVIALIVNTVRGIAIYKIAKQNNVEPAFLSFVPFAQGYVLGSLADDFKMRAKKKSSINRVLLPITMVAKGVAYIVLAVNLSGCIKDFVTICDKYPDWIPIAKGFEQILSVLPVALIAMAVFAVVSLVSYIFFNISIYRVFAKNKPTTAVVMTALAVMFGGVMALVMLFVAVKPEKAMKTDYNFDALSKKENIGIY